MQTKRPIVYTRANARNRLEVELKTSVVSDDLKTNVVVYIEQEIVMTKAPPRKQDCVVLLFISANREAVIAVKDSRYNMGNGHLHKVYLHHLTSSSWGLGFKI